MVRARVGSSRLLAAGLVALQLGCGSLFGIHEGRLDDGGATAAPDASLDGSSGRGASTDAAVARDQGDDSHPQTSSDTASLPDATASVGGPDTGVPAPIPGDDGGPIGCAEGATRRCGDDSEHRALGNCASGQETCLAAVWGPCSVKATAADACTPGDDANCNGTANDGCPCVEGTKQACGPAAEVGECRRGTQTCTNKLWGTCVGAVLSKPRDCASGLDVDCDGFPDNKIDSICKCAIGTTQDCSTHPGRDGKGGCRPGAQTCAASADRTTSAFGACTGSVGPAASDACDANNDANCNGIPNEGCACVNGTTQACGPPVALGVCKRGTQTCAASVWGTCVGAVYPLSRDCTSAADNDCNGTADNAESSCACVPTTTQACTTSQLGPCKPGTQTCVLAADKKSSAWGTCTGAARAAKDTCDPGNDANCNGIANEGCSCINSSTKVCGSDVGICQQGMQTCVNSVWGSCVGQVSASARDCTKSTDNDCNGTVDNQETPCRVCALGTTSTCATGKSGSCATGTRTCVAAADKQSVLQSACVAPLPAAKDNCNPADDANCDGTSGGGCCATRTCGTTCCTALTPRPNTTPGCSGSTCTNGCAFPISCSTADGRFCGSWNFDSKTLEGWGTLNSLGGSVTTLQSRYAMTIDSATPQDRSFTFVVVLCDAAQGADLTGKAIHYELSASPAQAGTFFVAPVLLDANFSAYYQISSGTLIETFPNGRNTETIPPGIGNATALGLIVTFGRDYPPGTLILDNVRIQ